MGREKQKFKTSSIIAKGTVLKGKLRVSKGLRIDGAIYGQIESASVLFLGEAAEVEADMQARVVFSSGSIQGNITATEQVHISMPGKVKGDIHTRQVSLERGVFFEGSCYLTKEPATP